ncbi:MmgE/PrpD family protein [Actinomadura sp. J1-007]|uniref:MmgE/PrpD family protein n=1 Tax=Actinomadura sp. J1-007 TaxID=2661913 RepID=UPI002815FE33|nr:MmgE/PrpD family protein [Actinomadura sp. J1-007]
MTRPPATPVQRLAAFADGVRVRGLPAELRADAARRVLDVLGNSLAATGEPPARAIGVLVREWGGADRATAIGTGLRLPSRAPRS